MEGLMNMNKFILPILITLPLWGCAILKQNPAPVTGITIAGYVYDEKGKPISDCKVVFISRSWPLSDAALITDVMGRFYGENINSVQGWIGFEHPQYAWFTMDKTEFTGKKYVKVVLHSLPEKLVVEGKKRDFALLVQDEKGKPVSDATIFYETQPHTPTKETKTDSQGRANLKDIVLEKDKNVSIRIKHPQYAECERGLWPQSSQAEIPVTLVNPFMIRGRALDEKTGKPISRIDVRSVMRVLDSKGKSNGCSGDIRISNMKGPDFKVEFNRNFPNYEEHRLYEVCARAPDYAWGRTQIVYDRKECPTQKDGVIINLNRGCTLKGKITDKQGRPISNAVCLCFDLLNDEYKVDKNGSFSFKHWPSYANKFFFRALGFKDKQIELGEIKEGKTIQLDIQMERFDETAK